MGSEVSGGVSSLKLSGPSWLMLCHRLCRYKRALRTATRLGWYASGVTGVCLGIVQLLVFSCYASAFWLGAYLVQEEIIQAGQFVTVSISYQHWS